MKCNKLLMLSLTALHVACAHGMISKNRIVPRAFACIIRQLSKQSSSDSLVPLKNGSYLPERDVHDIMRKMISLATHPGPQAAPALVELVTASFDDTNKLESDKHALLQKFNIVDESGALSDNAKAVIRSAVMFNHHNPELSLIGSPRVGHYLDRPYTLHSSEFNICSTLSPLAWSYDNCYCGASSEGRVQFWAGSWPFAKPALYELLYATDAERPDDAGAYLPLHFIENRAQQYYSQEWDDQWVNNVRLRGSLRYFNPSVLHILRDGLENRS